MMQEKREQVAKIYNTMENKPKDLNTLIVHISTRDDNLQRTIKRYGISRNNRLLIHERDGKRNPTIC